MTEEVQRTFFDFFASHFAQLFVIGGRAIVEQRGQRDVAAT